MAVSVKKIATNHKWENNNREKLTCILPLGTKDRIKEAGYTYNSFIVEAVLEKLEKLNK